MDDACDRCFLGNELCLYGVDERNDIRLPRLGDQCGGHWRCVGHGDGDAVYGRIRADLAHCNSRKRGGNAFVGCTCVNGWSLDRRLPRGNLLERWDIVVSRD